MVINLIKYVYKVDHYKNIKKTPLSLKKRKGVDISIDILVHAQRRPPLSFAMNRGQEA